MKTIPEPSCNTSPVTIAVIGGGASGMAAAWQAARVLRCAGQKSNYSVSLFERNERVGKKLLATGNGRCNLTNIVWNIGNFHGIDPSFARPALNRYPPEKVIALFGDAGLECMVEEDGKVFPSSFHAASVLDVLRMALAEANIRLQTGITISSIEKKGDAFTIHSSDGAVFPAGAVIVATGGRCAPATGSDGNGYQLLEKFAHTVVTPLPSIVQIKTDTTFVKPLSGQKIRGKVTLIINRKTIREENGEVLFSDYGLSGPPVLQLSGYVARAMYECKKTGIHPEIDLAINFIPHRSLDDICTLLRTRRDSFTQRTLEEYLTGLFHRRLAYGLLKTALRKPLSSPVSELTDNELSTLAELFTGLHIPVTGTMSFAHAQTTAGGIATADFDETTMESRICSGLYACGELLDIDGDCGGFNLQWAWASGFLAGRSAAERMIKRSF